MESFGSYRILEAQETGGPLEVYLAKGEGERTVQLKIFRKGRRTGEETLRIKRDLEVLAKVEHVRILPVLASGNLDDDLWYTVPEPPGSGLDQLIARRLKQAESPEATGMDDSGEAAPTGGFHISEVLSLAIGLGEALGYLHEAGLVYGHLDPQHIYMVPRVGLVLRESHPGAATGKAAAEETGVLRYASPEQVQLENVRPPSDVYQTGLLLYHTLTGKLPLEDENAFQTVLRRMQEDMPPPSRVRPEIKPELDQVILKCLKPRQEDRYQDMNAFLEEILRLDPQSGELLPGQEMPGDVKEEENPFVGLLIPSEKPKPVPSVSSSLSAVIPGALAGILILLAMLFWLR